MAQLQEEEIISYRLKSKEVTVGAHNPSIKKATASFFKLSKALCGTDSTDECETIYQFFKRDMEMYKFLITTSRQTSATCARELGIYADLHSQIDEQIEKTSSNIASLEEKLKEAKRARKEKEEGEVLAAHINQLPSRQASEEDIEKLRLNLDLMNSESLKTAQRLDLRVKQFYCLLQSLSDIKRSWEGEEGEETNEEEEEKDDKMDIAE